MKARARNAKKKAPARREPKQRRARETVTAVLDAVVRVLKKGGFAAVTTNRIAVSAGVSIGSVYQYFPDKRAIFTALHDRHAAAIGELIERTLAAHAGSPLEDLVRALIGALIDAHAVDPELHEILSSQVPHGEGGARTLEVRLRGALRLAVTSGKTSRLSPRDLERTLFVVPLLVEALAHGAAFKRPAALSLAAAKEEGVRAVMAYLRSAPAPRRASSSE